MGLAIYPPKAERFGHGLALVQAGRASVLLVVHQPPGLFLGMDGQQPLAPVLPASGAKGGVVGGGHCLSNSEPGVGEPTFRKILSPMLLLKKQHIRRQPL